MKNSLLLYLIIIVLLLNVFTYMYFSKQLTFVKDKSGKTEVKLKKDLEVANTKLVDANYFSLEKNENAQNYFNPDNATKTIQIEKLIPVVTEKLMDLNANSTGNPYVGQDQIGANKFIINKVRILNHRWIIADFSDGEYWGEVLIKYFVNEDETVSFETFQSLLYQK
jgi:preprotein translocase subunit SecF